MGIAHHAGLIGVLQAANIKVDSGRLLEEAGCHAAAHLARRHFRAGSLM